MAGFQDPFYLVREEIQGSVNGIKDNFSKFERLPATSGERAVLSHEIEQAAESVAWQLDELDKSVTVAERDPARFHVDAKECASRRAWVATTRAAVDRARTGVAAAKPAGGSKAGGSGLGAGRGGLNEKINSAAVAENDRFIGQTGEQAQELMRRQDESLDELSGGLERIGNIALEIGNELTAQDRLLTELDDDVSTTSGRLQASVRKVNALIKKAGIGGQLALIVFLVLLLVALVVVAVYF